MPGSLEKAVNITTVAVGIVALAIAAARYWPPSTPSPPYPVGSRLPSLPGVDLGAAPLTLIAVVKPSCPACEASMRLYKRIVEVRNRSSSSMQFVVVGPDAERALADYLGSHDVTPDAVVSVRRDALLVRSTPTLILANGAAIVQRLWVGVSFTLKDGRMEPSPEWEGEVIGALFGRAALGQIETDPTK